MKDTINCMIKYREGYRPFAPAALFERVAEVFDVDPGYECNYMEKSRPGPGRSAGRKFPP